MIFYIPEYGLYIVIMHQAIQVVSIYAVHQISYKLLKLFAICIEKILLLFIMT